MDFEPIKKSPVCACGEEMFFVHFEGYYDSLEFWICDNPECRIEEEFEPDAKQKGAFT